MKPLERFGRRVPALRFCILQAQLRDRKKRAQQRWEYRRTVYSILGHAVATWAGVEMVIDHLIEWYHPIAGAQNIQPDLPVTFDRKMDYVNKMARDPGWHDGGAALRWMRTEAKRLNKARKLMVHGVVWHLHPNGVDWMVQIREFDGPSSEIKSYNFRLEDLTEILSQISAFSSALAPRTAAITGLKAAKANANNSSANSG
jgi:hypothetical protein